MYRRHELLLEDQDSMCVVEKRLELLMPVADLAITMLSEDIFDVIGVPSRPWSDQRIDCRQIKDVAWPQPACELLRRIGELEDADEQTLGKALHDILLNS